MKKIIFLMGPTASGKTQLAIELAEMLTCEIISVDSTLVYQGMDIGTAKPSPAMQNNIPHHLINILDPKDSYSAGQFRQDALRLIKEIHQRNKLPLLVGGTMMYFRILQQGLAELPTANAEIRMQLQEQIKEKGLDFLYQRLMKIDPDAAKRIHPHDKQRIQRALEIPLQSGQTLTDLLAKSTHPLADYQIHSYAIAPQDKHELHTRIEQRFASMLKAGLIEEVRNLYQRGDLHEDLPAIRSVNYRQVWAYLKGSLNLDEMSVQAITATKQLAKRQLTWLRSWENLTWHEPTASKNSFKII